MHPFVEREMLVPPATADELAVAGRRVGEALVRIATVSPERKTPSEAQVRQVTEIMRAAGAADVRPIARSKAALTAGMSSASQMGG